MLEDNCDRIEEVGYMKPFTGEQLLEMKDRLSDLSIEINDIEIEKKASAELFKAQLKPLTEERGKLLDNIRNKAEHTKEKCFKFVDQEAGYVGYYSKDGFLVESRPIRQDERQKTIMSLGRETGTAKTSMRITITSATTTVWRESQSAHITELLLLTFTMRFWLTSSGLRAKLSEMISR